MACANLCAEGAKGAKGATRSRSASIAFVGLTIAIMAVSAWVTVPLGPVPFTLQMFALVFAIAVLSPGEALAAIAGYLALGAVGVPVFSGMRGGLGVLAGPTGGFLWGYLIGGALAVFMLWALRSRAGVGVGGTRGGVRGVQGAANVADDGFSAPSRGSLAQRAARFVRVAGIELAAGVLFTMVSYACGCLQFMVVAGVGAQAAFLTCVAPFVVVDALKIVAAVMCAQAVRRAVKR